MEERNPAPATKLAEKLSKYAYSGAQSPSRAPSSASPLHSLKLPSPAGPSTPTRRISTKTKRDLDDDYEDDEDTTPSRSKQARSKSTEKKKPRPFAGPEVYAHLRPVQDLLKRDLDLVFCGINPGKMSSTLGHHFAHPTNKFWRALHQSGLTPRYVRPAEDHLLPDLFNYGLTNLCGRPTAEQSELSTLEMRLSVPGFTRKIQAHRPRVVCFIGKKIWDVYESVVSKTARAAPLVKRETGLIKLEVQEVKLEVQDCRPAEELTLEKEETKLETQGIIKSEPDAHELPSSSAMVPATPSPSPRRTKKNPPAPFNPYQPRTLRLPYREGGGYTYFWVTPNTSGLERTPMSEQVNILRHLNEFLQVLKEGKEEGPFLDINVDGVEQTAESIKKLAEARTR